ncbi:MAG: 1-(5-phosphoribosyl)-5-[(5-phosphoribosylamino)methylideneamino]imidazole-4-carboxamide isomerase [candidate division KSB1 bacterium]|nr:1-(5-phosphoribosyl)-5-[(5-phosphoribosylamino)methylideneamino]imidazole-4-carboxamide isomerase [candidate division KSB1 bacterium]
MIIFPAIDLLNGAAVRLKQGAEKSAKVYSTNPAETARQWQEAGAVFLHVVDLDGAFGRPEVNTAAIEAILKAVTIPVQLGGGIRSLEDAARRLEAGVHRVIFGTAALEKPELIEESLARFGVERVVVGLDAKQNKVAVKGWEEQTDADLFATAKRMRSLGVERIIYTDVGRDGLLSGPNLAAADSLARQTGLKVIASGGFSERRHFAELAALHNPLIEGAIVGTALYEKRLQLSDLINEFQKVYVG